MTAVDATEDEPPAKRAREQCRDIQHIAVAPPTEGAGGNSPSTTTPPPYGEGSNYVAAADGWWAHNGGEWLYSITEKTYFHLPSGQLHLDTDSGTMPLLVESTEAPDSGDAKDVSNAGNVHTPAELEGTVRWFNGAKGFGFIAPPEGSHTDDIFVHRNQLVDADEDVFASLRPGTPVTFSVGQTDNGRICAVRVKVKDARQDGDSNEGADKDQEDEEDEGEDDDEDEESSASSVDIDLFEELHSGLVQEKGANKDHIEDYAVDKVKLPVSVLGETATCVFFGVFDGHGGPHCAEYVSTHLAKNILARLRDRTKNATDEMALRMALTGGFKQTEHNFLQHARRVGDLSGTTACTMTLFGPDEQMRLRLFLANAGDSRAVLGKVNGTAIRLTEDHKPNLPAEKKRIDLAGGSVAEVAGVWRCILPLKRRASGIIGLAVSRSFGDKEFKGPDIVSAEPDITIHEVDWDADELVILASDGIWDVVTDREAVQIVQRCLKQGKNEESAAHAVVQKALERGTQDDCTALVVHFGWLKASSKKNTDQTDGIATNEDEDPISSKMHMHQSVDKEEAEEGDEDMCEGMESDEDEGEDEEMEEDDDDEEGEEEEQQNIDKEEKQNEKQVQLPDDIFADITNSKEDVADPPDQSSTSSVKQDSTPLLAATVGVEGASPVGSGLFDGLGPTQEELAATVGPALPQMPSRGEPKEATSTTGGQIASATDPEMDMFG